MKLLIIFLSLILFGCEKESPSTISKTTPEIYTTFYPVAYFAQRIAEKYASVTCPVPENADAIFWEAYKHPQIIQKYQSADLIILNGAKFAKWVEKVSLPSYKMINTSKPLESEFIFINKAMTHSHIGGKEHSHTGLDGHTWVDPINAQIQAKEIKNALEKLLPQHKNELEKNYQALFQDLENIAKKLRLYQEHPENQTPLLASHPAYNYIARRFAWNIKNLDLDPEEMPSEETFAQIKNTLLSHKARYIIWESLPQKEISERFQNELELESIEFSPCELLSQKEQDKGIDYLSVMQQNIKNLKKIWP